MKGKKPLPDNSEPPEERATPPPDDPRRRSAQWDELGEGTDDVERLALLRLKALRATRIKNEP